MLVLTRKKGERVMIGDDIVVTVIDVRGDGVRIGFDAPRGVSIQRAEVVSAVKDANTGAAASAAQTGDLLVGLLSRARKAEPADGTEPGETPEAAAAEPAAESEQPATEAQPPVAAVEPATAEQPPAAPARTPAPARRPSGRPPKPTPPRP